MHLLPAMIRLLMIFTYLKKSSGNVWLLMKHTDLKIMTLNSLKPLNKLKPDSKYFLQEPLFKTIS
jgi:hypothetical protein